MVWVALSKKKPIEGKPAITRRPGYSGGSSFDIEDNWEKWRLDVSYEEGKGKPTHMWDGPFDSDMAIETWFKDHKE